MKRKLFMILSLLLSVLVVLAALPSVLAYSYGWWGGGGLYGSPMDYLQNTWVMFTIYFIFFFAIIYFTTNKSFKNPSVSAVVAAAASLFISMTLANRGWLTDIGATGTIGAWALLVAALIAIGFAIKFSYETFGRIGAIAAVFIIWFILHSMEDPSNILPPEILNDMVVNGYYFISGWWGLIVLLIFSGIIITARAQRRWTAPRDVMDAIFGK